MIFFLIEAWFGAAGVWYLVGLGATALLFSLFLPRGLWGGLEDRFGVRLLPVGYRLRFAEDPNLAEAARDSVSVRHAVMADQSADLPPEIS